MIVVLHSGGIDSSVLLRMAMKEGDTISLGFHYGGRHNRMEAQYARQQCNKLSIQRHEIQLSLPSRSFLTGTDDKKSDGPDTVVPMRNTIMLATACAFACCVGATEVWYGATREDWPVYADCRPEFVSNFNRIAAVPVHAPFIQWPRKDVVRYGSEFGMDWSETYSCYQGGEAHCGNCGACIVREKGFSCTP